MGAERRSINPKKVSCISLRIPQIKIRMAEEYRRAKRKAAFRDVGFNPKKKWDLRHTEAFKMFRAHRYTFMLNDVMQQRDISIHNDTEPSVKEVKDDVVRELLKEACDSVNKEGVPLNADVHLFLHCRGFKQDFVWNGVGSKALTLGELMFASEALDEIMSKFTSVIQSNDNAILDDGTLLQVVVFEPPAKFAKPPRYDYVNYK